MILSIKYLKPFFSKGKAGGTGLGMAIVKNIVEGTTPVLR